MKLLSWKQMTAAVILALLMSCGGSGSGGGAGVEPIISAELDSFPTGSVPPGFAPSGFNSAATVGVWDNSSGSVISTATVNMNGVILPYNPTDELYEGYIAVSPGDTVTLNVTVGGKTYTASGTQFTSYPAISMPLAGTTWGASCANSVMWSGGGPTQGKSILGYYLGILDANNPNGNLIWPTNNFLQWLSSSATSYVIPTNSITVGSRQVMLGLTQEVSVTDNSTYLVDMYISGFNYAPITVAAPSHTLATLLVSPTNQVIFNGATQQFTATGTYLDCTTQDVTPSVIWSSSDTGIATISNAVGSNGQATSVASGTTTITASSGAISNATAITIAPWILVNSGTSNDLHGVAWSGTQFVAVGDANTILTSPDGITWTAQASGTYAYFYGTAWLNSHFVTVGNGNNILTSPDGTTWTLHAHDSYSALTDIVWSGTEYVAVGNGICTSPDAVTWTSQAPGTTSPLYGVARSGTRFVAVGEGGTIITSPDGVTWASRTSGTTNALNSVAWSGTQFVAVGYAGAILTSPDGITWTTRGKDITDSLYGIVWSGTQFVAVGSNGGDYYGAGQILTSPDGITWTKIFGANYPPYFQSKALVSITLFGSRFVAVGNHGTILIFSP